MSTTTDTPGCAATTSLPLLLGASTVNSLLIAGEKSLKLIDVRPPELYAKGHIPQALNIHDIFSYIYMSGSDAKESKEALSEKFEGLFQEAGINGDDTVILYEDADLLSLYGTTCRGYYLLKLLGHPNVSILHGGFEVWVKNGLPTSTSAPVIQHKGTFTAKWTESMWSDKGKVAKAIKDKNAILLDVRDAIEWKGTVSSPVGVPDEYLAPRKGRIPGAVNIEWYEFTKKKSDNGMVSFQEVEELKQKCAAKGITPDSRVVVYCFVGMRSSLCYVALKEAGFENVGNYLGSWNEWSHDFNLEIDSKELDH